MGGSKQFPHEAWRRDGGQSDHVSNLLVAVMMMMMRVLKTPYHLYTKGDRRCGSEIYFQVLYAINF